jgi:hypothetical protein
MNSVQTGEPHSGARNAFPTTETGGGGVRSQTLSITFFVTVAVFAPARANAIELKPETLAAWNSYVRGADAATQARLTGHSPFLWIDEQPDRAARLRHGEVLVAPLDQRGVRSVPGGLIHHWIGAVFLPGATLDRVLDVVHDYGRYKDFYKPVVADSKALACNGTEQEFSMLWLHHVLFVNAAVQSRYEARDFPVDAHRWYTIAGTTRVQEVQDYGQPGEHMLPPGHGSGFIWQLHSIARYWERDGGVYVELEAIALTRDVPGSLRWLVNPVIARLSRNSLAISLRQTVDAVERPADGSSTLASCEWHRHSCLCGFQSVTPAAGF